MTPNHLPAAAIFDMDGVLVNSNPFHIEKWAEFLDEHGIRYDRDALPREILGKRNDQAFRTFFGPELSDEEMTRLSEEIEERFRAAFAGHAKPLPGLEDLIRECHQASIPMAVASSAMMKNVEFVVNALGFGPFFRHLVTGDEVQHPKPHPEIYLRAAERLGAPPAACVAFEDSFQGIDAVIAAGMKCVAITTTFPAEDLRAHGQVDLIVPSFQNLGLAALRRLFDAHS